MGVGALWVCVSVLGWVAWVRFGCFRAGCGGLGLNLGFPACWGWRVVVDSVFERFACGFGVFGGFWVIVVFSGFGFL